MRKTFELARNLSRWVCVCVCYLSTLTGGESTLENSEAFFPVVAMIVSPSDLSLSTKLSTSFPLAPSLRALLGPLGLQRRALTDLVRQQKVV